MKKLVLFMVALFAINMFSQTNAILFQVNKASVSETSTSETKEYYPLNFYIILDKVSEKITIKSEKSEPLYFVIEDAFKKSDKYFIITAFDESSTRCRFHFRIEQNNRRTIKLEYSNIIFVYDCEIVATK